MSTDLHHRRHNRESSSPPKSTLLNNNEDTSTAASYQTNASHHPRRPYNKNPSLKYPRSTFRKTSLSLSSSSLNLRCCCQLVIIAATAILVLFITFFQLLCTTYNNYRNYEIIFNRRQPKLLTNQPSYDYAYNLALSELQANVVVTSKGGILTANQFRFIAGQYWDTTWTRDTSYAAEQATSLLYPHVVKNSLLASVDTIMIHGESKQVWLQDECGHFGRWPHLSDAIVGARGAWSLYRATADIQFLRWAYDITKNTLSRAEYEVYDKGSGLFMGCSSFMESNSGYPFKYFGRGDLVAMTKALSTNALYYSGYKIAAFMGRELGVEEGEYVSYWEAAEMLRHAIRKHFWLEEKGYYGYFIDEDNELVKNFEGLGESLVLLDGIERNHDRISSMFAKITLGEYGLPCLWPKFDHPNQTDISHYYHNGRLWPFVQGYYSMAAAKHGQVDVIAHSLQSLTKLAVSGETFAEFYESEDGSFIPERRRQLWSATGYLAMIYQGVFGITYEVDGLRFAPNKPASLFPDEILLTDFIFRDMTLDITVKGSGSKVKSFTIDGGIEREKYKGAFFLESTMHGKHKVVIVVEEW